MTMNDECDGMTSVLDTNASGYIVVFNTTVIIVTLNRNPDTSGSRTRSSAIIV